MNLSISTIVDTTFIDRWLRTTKLKGSSGSSICDKCAPDVEYGGTMNLKLKPFRQLEGGKFLTIILFISLIVVVKLLPYLGFI